MKLSGKVAAATLFLVLAGTTAAFAAEAMCACCKDMKEKMACCDEMKKGETAPNTPAPQHQH